MYRTNCKSKLTDPKDFLSFRNTMMFTSVLLNNILFQVLGKYYLRIDPLGEGTKWRRSFGQEIYSPLLVAFTEQVREKH